METKPNSDSCVIYPKPNTQANLRLFCVPYAGSGAYVFSSWQEGLPPTVELCAIELPGHGIRMKEAPFTQIMPLVKAIANALLPHLDKPFAFFGQCIGALIIFELAHQLRNQYGLSPDYLFVSGCGAPQRRYPHKPFYTLPEPKFIKMMRFFNILTEEMIQSSELIQVMLPLLRADMSLHDTYVYKHRLPLPCPIFAFGGLHDPILSRRDFKSWSKQTSTYFSLRMFPGQHIFIHTAKALLLQTLSQLLQQQVSIATLRKNLENERYKEAW